MCISGLDKFFTTKINKCLKHINLKKEREQKHTAFWLEVEQKQVETHSLDEEERDERLLQQLLSKP